MHESPHAYGHVHGQDDQRQRHLRSDDRRLERRQRLRHSLVWQRRRRRHFLGTRPMNHWLVISTLLVAGCQPAREPQAAAARARSCPEAREAPSVAVQPPPERVADAPAPPSVPAAHSCAPSSGLVCDAGQICVVWDERSGPQCALVSKPEQLLEPTRFGRLVAVDAVELVQRPRSEPCGAKSDCASALLNLAIGKRSVPLTRANAPGRRSPSVCQPGDHVTSDEPQCLLPLGPHHLVGIVHPLWTSAAASPTLDFEFVAELPSAPR